MFMKRYFKILSIALFVLMSLSMTSCKDKDDEPKLWSKHSMIVGKWNFILSKTDFFYRDPVTGEEIAIGEDGRNCQDENWDFTDTKVTIHNFEESNRDDIYEYQFRESTNQLFISDGTVWKIVKLTSKQMTLYRECKVIFRDDIWMGFTFEFVKS